MTTLTVDNDKLMDFVHKTVEEISGAVSAIMVDIGDKLGLYRALAGAGPLSSQQLADRTGTAERYVREWLANQAAGGLVTYDPASQRYTLPDEIAAALTDENCPAYLPGIFQLLMVAVRDEGKVIDAFRTGKGVAWHEHDPELFPGVERFFRPGYNASLVSSWIPALDGVEAKLRTGARAADIGCGYGASTILLAQAYPQSTFVGYDFHAPSIDAARQRAAAAGVSDRVTFGVAPAKEYPGTDYDVVAFFDCLHDMGDPVGAAKHVRASLKPDGTWLLVEPFAWDRLEDALNPLGRMFYGFSALMCMPASLAQEVGLGLGNQASDALLREVVMAGGFTRFRRATETPFNRVFEARP